MRTDGVHETPSEKVYAPCVVRRKDSITTPNENHLAAAPAWLAIWHPGSVEPKPKPILLTESKTPAQPDPRGDYDPRKLQGTACAQLVKAVKRRSGLDRQNPWLTVGECAGFLGKIPTIQFS